MNGVDAYFDKVKQATRDLPPYVVPTAAFTAGIVSILGGRKVYGCYFRRVRSGDWVTPADLQKKRRIKGVVTSVGDADNFRLYHTPGFGWRWPLKVRRAPTSAKDLKDETLHIRMAGVDAPEGAHFGRPAQPYADEALSWLRSRVLNRTVYCQLIRRDQYSRIVAVVRLAPRILPAAFFKGKDLSLEMLKAGWATTYEQAGAEYGQSTKEEFQRVEAAAKAARKGMWQGGVKGESPAEYKRRYAQLEASGESKSSSSSKSNEGTSKGWFRRVFFR